MNDILSILNESKNNKLYPQHRHLMMRGGGGGGMYIYKHKAPSLYNTIVV